LDSVAFLAAQHAANASLSNNRCQGSMVSCCASSGVAAAAEVVAFFDDNRRRRCSDINDSAAFRRENCSNAGKAIRCNAGCSDPPFSSSQASTTNSNDKQKKEEHKEVTVHGNFTVRSDAANYWTMRRAVAEQSAAFLMHHVRVNRDCANAMTLSDGGVRLLTTPNAGGTSEWSEAISFEILRALFGATLRRTEMEIEYKFCNSKITDYSVTMHDAHIGVSVTRAMCFDACNAPFDRAECTRLLAKKLDGVIASTAGVVKEQRWQQQILHIIAENEQYAQLIRDVYQHDIGTQLKSNTIVIVSTTSNASFLF
jgi:hypothetical protein